jgi:hypothetical protein
VSHDQLEREELDGDRVFVLHHFCTAEECEQWLEHSESLGYGEAPLSTSAGPVINKGVRDNSRLMVDEPALATTLWDRARPFLPVISAQWKAVGFNERFRYYRYERGEKFAPHYDGYFDRDPNERSHLTFMIYLNEGFEGGETHFYDDFGALRFSVRPEKGMALVFAHRQLHEGAAVLRGRKYVLRTDVMYRRTSPATD